jgi:3',5'-cyclic AMP phosphodiesterase CpdA
MQRSFNRHGGPVHHAAVATVIALTVVAAVAHEPTPDPLLSYTFSRRHLVPIEAGVTAEPNTAVTLKPQFGPPLVLGGQPVAEPDTARGLRFAGLAEPHRVPADAAVRKSLLPEREFTVSAWASVDEPQQWGGILSALEDNGGFEKGLVVGYDESRFFVGLATEGGSDANGTIEYLRADRPYTRGRWHHVAATYDGQTLTLYVDGKPAGSSRAQSGPIVWPEEFGVWLGGYRDSDERYPHAGRLGDVKLFAMCAKPSWVAHEFEHGAELVALPADQPPPAAPAILVAPYLQWGTADGITIMWETAHACRGVVRYGEDSSCPLEVVEAESRTIHEITLEGLEPDLLYFYRTESPVEAAAATTPAAAAVTAAATAKPLVTDVRTFQTAARPDVPVAFAVLCDTQASPQVVRRVAEAAWELRPQFVLLGGDLVTTGSNKRHWTEHYFPNMEPLASRVVVYPVLGNHEQNASWYYDYMHLPAPEYFYTFRRGNVQFFMLDTNKDVSPGTEQYQWLDKELAASTATWKVCMHHQPPFSSDDDYGNDWKRPIKQATLGDRQAKPLVALYDKHAVDVVWSGHIHSYERTWMIRGGKPVTDKGTVYMITGGAGGHLETFGPYRPAFQNRIRRGHHFCYVTCLGGEFDIKAFDDEGRLFDHATLRKPVTPRAPGR